MHDRQSEYWDSFKYYCGSHGFDAKAKAGAGGGHKPFLDFFLKDIPIKFTTRMKNDRISLRRPLQNERPIKIKVSLFIEDQQTFAELNAESEKIASGMGFGLKWVPASENPGHYAKCEKIVAERELRASDVDDTHEQFEWLVTRTQNFIREFGIRLSATGPV